MKRIVYAIINFFLQFGSFRKFVTILNWEKNAYVETIISKQISPDNKVLAGPFKGMIYPELVATGSPLLPKIVGSYEDELHGIFNKITGINYKTAIDVGCAEGYYAVGLAMRLPEAKVFAFDTDQLAIARCKNMAEVNGVGDRVELKGFCDANNLKNFPYQHPSLIISDCEGYEKELFTKDNISALKQTDVLIELHPQAAPNVLNYITDLFKDSHKTVFITSGAKHVANYPALKSIDKIYYKDLLLMERDDLMTWVFLEAKSGKN